MTTKYIEEIKPNLIEDTPEQARRVRFMSEVHKNQNAPAEINDYDNYVEHKFSSSTTVPTTEWSDGIGKQSAFLSVSDPTKLKRQSIHRKRIIFKNKRKRREKTESSHQLSEQEINSKILNAKVDYFFKPYIGETNIHDEPPMSFDDRQVDQIPASVNDYNEGAKFNWNRLWKKRFWNKDEDEFRKFLLSINNSCDHSAETLKKEKEKPMHELVADGLRLLKSLVQQKVISQCASETSHQTRQEKLEDCSKRHHSQPIKHKRRGSKPGKTKAKVSWRDAEVIDPSEYSKSYPRQLQSQMFANTMKNSWKNEEMLNQLTQKYKSKIDFWKTSNNNEYKSHFLPCDTEKVKKHVKDSGYPWKFSSFNSEKFVVALQVQKITEKMEKLKASSWAEKELKNRLHTGLNITTKDQYADNLYMSTKMKKFEMNFEIRKKRERVQKLTPILLDSSANSSLSVSICTDRE